MLIELVHCKKKTKKKSFVRLRGDREEIADLILTLNGCLLGSGQRNTHERTYRNRLLEDWLEYPANADTHTEVC